MHNNKPNPSQNLFHHPELICMQPLLENNISFYAIATKQFYLIKFSSLIFCPLSTFHTSSTCRRFMNSMGLLHSLPGGLPIAVICCKNICQGIKNAWIHPSIIQSCSYYCIHFLITGNIFKY